MILVKPLRGFHASLGRVKPCTLELDTKLRTGTKSRILLLLLGAGVTPAQGSLKPTAGFISIKFFDFSFYVNIDAMPVGLTNLPAGFIGGAIFGTPNGMIGAILVATVGAVILVWISHLVKRV